MASAVLLLSSFVASHSSAFYSLVGNAEIPNHRIALSRELNYPRSGH